jgi:hypothetical protein
MFKMAIREDRKWMWVFKVYKIYRNDFQNLLRILPLVTENIKDNTIYLDLICANYIRFFQKNKKMLDFDFNTDSVFSPITKAYTRDEKLVAVYYTIAVKKPKHLAVFRGNWMTTRKYTVLTKKKYETLYLHNFDVDEVLVLEEIQKRPLEHYTAFVAKITLQYFIMEKEIGIDYENKIYNKIK